MHVYEVRPRRDHRGVDLISDALPFGRLWYVEPNAASNAVDYAKFYSRSHDGVIRVYDDGRRRERAPLPQPKAFGEIVEGSFCSSRSAPLHANHQRCLRLLQADEFEKPPVT
jgi:hypothetical protein